MAWAWMCWARWGARGWVEEAAEAPSKLRVRIMRNHSQTERRAMCGARPRPGAGISLPAREGAAGGRASPTAASAELVLETWDLQCESNGREHRTAEMGGQQLVVRRGQPFTITLHFSGRGYEEGVDKLAFNVETGECRCAPRENPQLHAAQRGGFCLSLPPLPPRLADVLASPYGGTVREGS